jgi:hypothetical protein
MDKVLGSFPDCPKLGIEPQKIFSAFLFHNRYILPFFIWQIHPQLNTAGKQRNTLQ